VGYLVFPDQIFAELTAAGQPLRVVRYQAWHQGRHRVEQFIANCFRQVHGAVVSSFLPSLITLESPSGELFAAVGVRSAHSEKLFLEQYLAQPIEFELSRISKQICSRRDVIEVGNLAIGKAGISRTFFAVLADVLNAWGARWVTCTGTTQVSNIFQRLAVQPIRLGNADASRLADHGDSWGSYYQHHPVVMAGELEQGHSLVQKSGLLTRINYQRLENDNALIA